LLSGSTGISYNSSTGAISYSGTVYTDASVRALISLTTTGTSGASTYNNTTGVINVPNYTLAGLGGISLTSLSGGTGITYNNTTGAISYSGTVYTDASVRALISATGSVSYNNTTGVISLTSGNLTEATSSVLTITGGTGAVLGSGTSIQVKQASTTVSGFLSSTDFNTFNSKASALSGTTGYHAKFTSSSAIGDSLIFDNGTSVGIGTASPVSSSGFQRFLHIAGGASLNSGLCLSGQNTGGQGTIGYDSSILYIDSLGATIGANNTITFNTTSVNGNTTRLERMRITADGNVGIGSTSIRAKLDVSDGTTNTSGEAIYQGLYTGSTRPSTSDLTAILTIQSNDAMAADKGGSIAFGGRAVSASSAGANWAGISGLKENGTSANYSGYLQFWTRGGSTTEKMRINSDGNVGIGGTATAKLHVFTANNTNGGNAGSSFNNEAFVIGATGKGILMQYDQTNNKGHIGVVQPGVAWGALVLQGISGNVLLGTSSDNGEKLYVSGAIRATSTITANSDIRIKSNITKIENALEKVGQISGYTYNTNYDDKRHGGVIAQEIDKVFPEIVNTGNDGLMGVEYGNISALLIEAIKEQNTKIKNLETLLASK
jgi:hypothetical protein